MIRLMDEASSLILKAINESKEPLETKEILEKVYKTLKNSTRTIVLYRLNMLRGDQKIFGKFVGPGKGVWIWWSTKTFNK